MEFLVLGAVAVIGLALGKIHSLQVEHFRVTAELLARMDERDAAKLVCDSLGPPCAVCPRRQRPALPAVPEEPDPPEPAPLPTARLLQRGR